MTLQDIARLRLVNQHIGASVFTKPADVVAHMGAMQAQDYAMVKWGVGLRLPGATDAAIEQAIDDGTIVRTHIMRPTWHLVAATDARWMMALSAPRLRPVLNANNRRLELTGAVFNKCNTLIEKALGSGRHMTRNELMAVLQQHGIATNDLRSTHIMFRAEIDMVVCSGARKGKESTYALFDERIPGGKGKDRPEAVAALFHRYFTSHGPATLQDFVWWSGLTLTDAKAGLELNRPHFDAVVVDAQAYWFAHVGKTARPPKEGLRFLPAFDEYLVSYKDRSASLAAAHFSSCISSNGIFWPVIVADGGVVGTWKRTIKKDIISVTPSFCESIKTPAKALLEKALQSYAQFIELPLSVV